MRLVPTNPMNRALMSILIFEAICCGLAIPGMIQVGDASVGLAFGLGGTALLLCLAASGMLRRPIGWTLAWAAQLACVALGFAVAMMFAVGAVFLVLFAIGFVLGKRLEATRTAG
ncbi:MAG: DUF4233 domain-containing protein [Micropruina sp.]|uniref:DUF4233 domain-containing protein n=1 Tax=Micropruina sp. TaxID=2737536 RepID=UPI0039E3A99A